MNKLLDKDTTSWFAIILREGSYLIKEEPKDHICFPWQESKDVNRENKATARREKRLEQKRFHN